MTSLQPSAILETALYADNLDSAEEFYGSVIGLKKISRVGTRHVFFRCGAGVLLIFNASETVVPSENPDLPVPPHGSTGAGHVCFSATARELDTWRETFARHGIAIEADFAWPNGARSVYIRDPAGNSVEFAEPRLWSSD